MYTDGDFALNQYIPYTLVPFHPLFQERGGLRVERDQADWEVIIHFIIFDRLTNIFQSFSIYKCCEATRRFTSRFLDVCALLPCATGPTLGTLLAPLLCSWSLLHTSIG